MGVSLIQGGSGYPLFAPSTFSYMSGSDVCSTLVGREEIADPEVKQALDEVCTYYIKSCIPISTLLRLHRLRMTVHFKKLPQKIQTY